jgi:MraZ protein
MIGQGNKFEIWDESKWNERRAEWLSATEADGELPDELGSLSL